MLCELYLNKASLKNGKSYEVILPVFQFQLNYLIACTIQSKLFNLLFCFIFSFYKKGTVIQIKSWNDTNKTIQIKIKSKHM